MEALNWIEQKAKLSDLKPYERNPRRISKDAYAHLKKSIEQDGYHGRMLCTPDLKVLGGHQRLRVLKDLGYKEVNVLIPSRELTTDEYRRILIRDNLQAGEWDMDMLGNDFEVEELLDWGFPKDLLNLADEAELPDLASGEKEPFQQVTFTLHNSQAEVIKAALDKAKAAGGGASEENENSNGNAIAHVCRAYLEGGK